MNGLLGRSGIDPQVSPSGCVKTAPSYCIEIRSLACGRDQDAPDNMANPESHGDKNQVRYEGPLICTDQADRSKGS
jgi:hypothetical protein